MFKLMYLTSRLSRNLSRYASVIAILLIFSLVINVSAKVIGSSMADHLKSQSIRSYILFLDSNAYNFREYVEVIEGFRANKINLKLKYTHQEKYDNDQFDIIITDNIADIRDLYKLQLLSTIEDVFLTVKNKDIIIHDYYIEVIDIKQNNKLYIAIKANLMTNKKYFQMEIINYILHDISKKNNIISN